MKLICNGALKPVQVFALIIFFYSLSCTDEEVLLNTGEYRIAKIDYFSDLYSEHPNSSTVYNYDGSGRVIKESHLDYLSILTYYFTFEYRDGNLWKKSIFDGQTGNLQLGGYTDYEYVGDLLVLESQFYADGSLFYSKHYEYSGENLVHTWNTVNNQPPENHIYYQYDDRGNLVTEESVWNGIDRDNLLRYYYDDFDRLVRKEQYSGDSTLNSIEEYRYDNNSAGYSAVLFYNPAGILFSEMQYYHDSNGNLISGVQITGNSSFTSLINKYMGGLLIEERRYFSWWGSSGWNVTRYQYAKP